MNNRDNRDNRNRDRKSRDGTPVLTSQAIKNADFSQPTFKLEMFNPPPVPQRPYAEYELPTAEMSYIQEYDKKGNLVLKPNKYFDKRTFPLLFSPTSATSYANKIKVPMQTVNYIMTPGPTGGHPEMNTIYENILPGKDNRFTSMSVGERIQLYDYVRQILIKVHDGEDISLDSGGHHNLLSYIKFMELNPNHYSPINNNPYKGLPFGILIYRSCFPIRLDQRSQSIVCAKDSIGLNIRLYALSCAEHFTFKFRNPLYLKYDVWRELAYYEYVRENIIKTRQSPNFPLLYAYFLSPNKKIDFFALKKTCMTQKDLLSKEYRDFLQVQFIYSKADPRNKVITSLELAEVARKSISKLPDEIDPSLQLYSGTTLVLVTEAPHHNLYMWASRTYEVEGIMHKQLSHGSYDEKVWLGVLFQIVSALYVMQIHGIYIRDMTIEDNVYIKDLQTYGKAMGYWKYVIDGISYYVPNYGYLVFIDSNFKNIIPKGRTISRCKREYKIYSPEFLEDGISHNDIGKNIFNNYHNIINTNVFTAEHTQNNVMRPPEVILKLIEKMMVDPETNLGNVIATYFRPLMNNRIGTLLKKDLEVPNRREITGKFKKGDMAIEVLEEELYKWCLVNKIKENGIVEIVTREDGASKDFITKDIRIENLNSYAASEKIEQATTPDVNFSEEEMLETYIVKI